MKTLTWLLDRNLPGRRARRVAGRAAVALTGAGAAIALAGPALAAPAWVITPTVNPSAQKVAFSNVLNAVDARTPADAWAVGNFLGPNDDDGQVMLAEHWNGSAWSQVPTPNIMRSDEKLNAVSAAAANDVWAVGSVNQTGFAHTDPLAAHWDGSAWTIVPTPSTTGGAKSILFGVANLGTANAWAVGRSEANRALIEHWDGSAWTIVPSPNPAAPTPAGVSQALNGVVEISPNDAWAVGNTTDITGFVGAKPIAMHWNGTAWSVSTLPDLGTGGTLASVTASSATSVWAAGLPGGTTSVLHWNGTSWAPETTPVGPDGQPIMNSIRAVPGSATEVWAAGITLPSGGGYHTFVVHHP